MPFPRWILASLVLHGLFVGFLLVTGKLRPEGVVRVEEIPVEFQAVIQPKVKVSTGAPHRSQGRKPSLPGSATKKAASLFKVYDLSQGDLATGDAGPESDFRDTKNYRFDSSNMFGENDHWDYHREVFQRIDSQLIFDSILAQYNHFGTVMLQFEVNRQGYLLGDSLRAEAEDSILKVHVVRALRKALAEEFPQTKWSEGTTVFQAKFDFMLGSESMNSQKQKEFAKPVLVFRRATLEKPTANTLSDHLLNGGISYDAFAMAEKWEKYNKKKRLAAGEFDPFAHYRNDPAYRL